MPPKKVTGPSTSPDGDVVFPANAAYPRSTTGPSDELRCWAVADAKTAIKREMEAVASRQTEDSEEWRRGRAGSFYQELRAWYLCNFASYVLSA